MQDDRARVRNMDLIVIPTYQEARTISGLLERIQGAPELDTFHILVVDDASPDGTGAVVRAHPSYGERVLLLERGGKDGLGAAYRPGVLAAIAMHGTEASGYSFQVETTWRASRLGLRLVEVPITFVERQEG